MDEIAEMTSRPWYGQSPFTCTPAPQTEPPEDSI